MGIAEGNGELEEGEGEGERGGEGVEKGGDVVAMVEGSGGDGRGGGGEEGEREGEGEGEGVASSETEPKLPAVVAEPPEVTPTVCDPASVDGNTAPDSVSLPAQSETRAVDTTPPPPPSPPPPIDTLLPMEGTGEGQGTQV